MRAKFVYEKFEEDSDPIRDMGIGAAYRKKFESANDFYDNIISSLPVILQVKNMKEVKEELKKFTWDKNHFIPSKLFKIIDKWINEKFPIKINNNTITIFSELDDHRIYLDRNKTKIASTWPVYVAYKLYKLKLVPEYSIPIILDFIQSNIFVKSFY